MKKAGKLLAVMLSLTLMLSMGALSAFAAEEYQYQVTISAGTQGVFTESYASGISCERSNALVTPTMTRSTDGKRIVISGLQAGDQLSFSDPAAMVTLNDDSKYYVSGVRMSGVDNNNISGQRASFTVSDDRDYVIAYGIQGDVVKGTIRYVNTSGTNLLDERIFYGNVGDVRVVSYAYIDGYQPQAYNLSKTLVADEAQNIFTFVYTPIPATTTPTTTTRPTTTTTPTTTTRPATTTTTPAAGTAGNANAAANNAAANNAAANNANANANAADANAANADGTNVADNAVPAAAPEDMVDLDENETPLAGTSGTDTGSGTPATDGTNSESGGSRLPAIIGAIAVAITGAGGGGYYYYRRRRK